MRARLVTPENKKWWTLAAVSVGLFDHARQHRRERRAAVDAAVAPHVAVEPNGSSPVRADVRCLDAHRREARDYIGRRLIFMVGLAVFTGASLACGLAPNGGF
jgi:hypothetical protein